MADVTGKICDVCDRFAVTKEGWMKLQPLADKDAKGFDICSNRCLLKLAKERAKESGESVPRGPGTFTDQFKMQVVEHAMATTPTQAAVQHGVDVRNVRRWIEAYNEGTLK